MRAMRHDGTTGARGTTNGVSVHWGGVFAGTIVGLGALVLLSSFWIALGFGSSQGWVAHYLGWWLGAMLLVSLAIGGFVTGRSARSAASASVNAVVLWGLTMIGLTIAGATTLFSAIHLQPLLAGGTNAVGPWLTFVAIGLGLLFALGGAGAGAGSQRSAESGTEVQIPEDAGQRTTEYQRSAR